MAMKVLLSWVKDFVDIDLSLPELAHRLTMAGLEVEAVQLVACPCRKVNLSCTVAALH